jgi:NADPH2:quinone reductase
MRAVVIEDFGGPEAMVFRDLPIPVPGPGQVRVRVAFAALNPLDVNVRRGLMKWRMPPMPATLGYEYSGTVDAVGPGVAQAMLGARVGSLGEWGGYADYALATAASVTPIPDGMPLNLGAVYFSTAETAWHVLHTVGRVKPGDLVVVHSAAGAIGIMTTQIAREAGATVIGLVGGEDKIAWAKPYGADHLIDYRADSTWPATVKRLAGRGADLIVDGVQGPEALKSLEALAPLGQIVYLGASGGAAPDVPIGRLIAGSAGMRGLVVYDAMKKTQGAEIPEIQAKIMSGAWRYPLNPAVPLADVVAAHTAFENRALPGRTIFRVGSDI